MLGAEAAVRTAVRGDEDDRVRNRGGPDVAGELEERGRAGPVVVRSRRLAEVVAVRHHDDGLVRAGGRVLRARGCDRDDVLEALATAPGHVRGEGLALDGEAVALQLGGDVVRRLARVDRARRALRSRPASTRANCTAVVRSNEGGRRGCWRATGRPTLKAATRSGTATAIQAAR